MGIGRCRIAQQRGQIGLPRSGGQQVFAAHHLVDALRVVIDHYRDVVGGDAIAAPYHEIVDQARVFTVQ